MDMKRREENSVRVTNLSEDTREDDLRVSNQLVCRCCTWAVRPASHVVSLRMHARPLLDMMMLLQAEQSFPSQLSLHWLCSDCEETDALTAGHPHVVCFCARQELFSPFGPISRIYIAYDRETGENRGFAFVNFVYRSATTLPAFLTAPQPKQPAQASCICSCCVANRRLGDGSCVLGDACAHASA